MARVYNFSAGPSMLPEDVLKKAQAEIKKEIVDVSAVLTEKMLGREINTEDHHAIINTVISEIGEAND